MAEAIEISAGGRAEQMGDGVFVLTQHDDERGTQNVVVTRADLETLLAAC